MQSYYAYLASQAKPTNTSEILAKAKADILALPVMKGTKARQVKVVFELER